QDEFPPLGTSWFWSALALIVLLHVAIASGLVALDLKVPAINRLPRMLYGFLTVILLIEWRISIRIIEICWPHKTSNRGR
ncbi:MAG TPA: hypothetical protein VGR50_03760, partial [Terriglobales bacterium]|nr:hypothetical protein [Terriglobales bacterium]